VKGPEDLEREMVRNAEFAEARLALESEPKAQEQAKEAVQEFVAEEGIDQSLENPTPAAIDMVSGGSFEVIVTEQNHEPALAVAPTGNVSEIYPLKTGLQQQLLLSIRSK
jgi:hypothetical protein